MFDIIDQNLQRFAINRLDDIRIGLIQVQHPFQDLVLLHQIAGVDGAEFVPIESQCRQLGQIVFLVDAFVGRFDEVNALLFALVVDVLQFVEDFLRFFVSLAIWQSNRIRVI